MNSLVSCGRLSPWKVGPMSVALHLRRSYGAWATSASRHLGRICSRTPSIPRQRRLSWKRLLTISAVMCNCTNSPLPSSRICPVNAHAGRLSSLCSSTTSDVCMTSMTRLPKASLVLQFAWAVWAPWSLVIHLAYMTDWRQCTQ